ncbi:MAG: ComEA family DNA-binding protein [Myxococcota bacterium]
MRSRAQWSLVAALAMLLLGSAGEVLADPPDTNDAPETRLVGVVNINTASSEELQLLPGIGPARARALIAYRKEKGPFRDVGELVRVSGIGERALARIRPHCVLKGKSTARLRSGSASVR